MKAQGNISPGSVLCSAHPFDRANFPSFPTQIRLRTVWQDYLALFRALHPECDALPLSRAQYRRLLPFATALQTLVFFFFLLIEASGGAGGTSVVAGTRTVSRQAPKCQPPAHQNRLCAIWMWGI